MPDQMDAMKWPMNVVAIPQVQRDRLFLTRFVEMMKMNGNVVARFALRLILYHNDGNYYSFYFFVATGQS